VDLYIRDDEGGLVIICCDVFLTKMGRITSEVFGTKAEVGFL